MVTLRKPRPDPEQLYETVMPFSVGRDVFNPGVRLRGDHEAVVGHYASFLRSDLPDDEKARLRGMAIFGEPGAAGPGPKPDPVASLPSGRFVATRSWRLADDDLQDRGRINAGDVLSYDDPVVVRYWHLFTPYLETR